MRYRLLKAMLGQLFLNTQFFNFEVVKSNLETKKTNLEMLD
jgi:hypothetical protein